MAEFTGSVGDWSRLAAFCLAFASAVPQAGSAGSVPEPPLAAKVLGTEIRTGDPEEVRYWVLRKLTDRYAAEKGIAVTPQEIDAYIEAMKRSAENDREEREARRAEIQQQLDSPGLADSERRGLSRELESIEQLQRNLDEMSGGDADEERQARRLVAGAFIRQWKINQALYGEYGGRIVFQQGGPEPLDAYRRFLEERQARGEFEILNKDLDAAFWRYYVADSIHSFYPPGSEEEKGAFAAPWWLPD